MESKVSHRLKQPLAPEVIKYLFLPRLNREFHANFEHLTEINLAHLCMLGEQKILDDGAVRKLASALLKIREEGPDAVELDPAREEAYFNYEAHLIRLVGADLGGRLHTARSRNDMGATIDHIRARDFTVQLATALLSLASAALGQAERFSDHVMPGYTHMQSAQPISYGFYLSGLVDAWTRDLGRLLHVLETADASPLGACALAGTSFPIDSGMTSELLGFSKPVGNALDGVASRDFALELSAALSIMMITCSRMVQDFYIWSTPEFGLISFPDSIASTSSIMPQKKNPAVLEYLRGKTAHLIGLTSASFTTVKSTHFTHSGDSSRESTRTVWESCEEALKALELMTLLIKEVEPDRERMIRRAQEDFSTVTDLADLLVRKAGISFRDAHHVIGAVVRKALDQGITARAITADMLNAVASDQLDRDVKMDASDVDACLDPVRNLDARRSPGGPASTLVLQHIGQQRETLSRKTAIIETTRQRVLTSRQALSARIQDLIAPQDTPSVSSTVQH